MQQSSKFRLWSIIAVVIVVLFLIISFFVSRNGDHTLFEVQRGDLSINTEVFGKVVPGEEIDLSFETIGRVSVINVQIGDEVRAGDILARLNSAQINSEIEEAAANLEAQEARLSEISGQDSNQDKLQSVKETLISKLKKSYILADDVVKNYIDSFISEPNERSPKFDLSLQAFFIRKDIEESRYQVGLILDKWKTDVDNLKIETVSLNDAQKFIANLKEIEKLLALISDNSSEFIETQNKTKAQIDSYLLGISQSRTNIATAIVDINTSTESLRSVQAEIPVLTANANSARAVLDKLIAKSDNYVIRAPFDGVITDKVVELGVVVSAGEKAFSMVSNKPFEIESFVPEVNIAGVDIGDSATIKLDAFGDDVSFTAKVTHIDPRETVKDALSTYRIVLNFTEFDKSILSGMSAEINIEKDRIFNQVIIPRYLITRENDKNFVDVYKNNEIIRTEIQLGQRDNSGNVIVVSGIAAGDKLVIPESK